MTKTMKEIEALLPNDAVMTLTRVWGRWLLSYSDKRHVSIKVANPTIAGCFSALLADIT